MPWQMLLPLILWQLLLHWQMLLPTLLYYVDLWQMVLPRIVISPSFFNWQMFLPLLWQMLTIFNRYCF